MLSFASDYIAGAHPEILRRLMETNLEPLPGYGSDPYCRSAAEKILSACGCTEGQVRFLVGGTQTNQLVIDTLLRPWEGVLSAETGHVSVHEAGAIEFSGHKVLTLPQESGKLRSEDVEAFCAAAAPPAGGRPFGRRGRPLSGERSRPGTAADTPHTPSIHGCPGTGGNP